MTTVQEHIARIEGEARDLFALLQMCSLGADDVDASRVMNAASVFADRIAVRAKLAWELNVEHSQSLGNPS
jgi:hypothetical protein